MSKLNKVFLYALVGALLLTLMIILMPNSIENYYQNPEIYDNGFSYYLWKFRPIDRSNVARITAWTFFALHLIANIYLFKKLKEDMPNKKEGLSKYNFYLLYTNLGFILLHFLHTAIWYDALAQDTPVWSSQGSVIVMLVLILIMENSRRGLFFGKSIKLPKESTSWVMKNHGKFIALATIFTFWYHPMEFTVGHLFGFFYMFLLFIQMSLTRTKIHQNMYFKIALEVLVLFHGTTVALVSGNAPWAMFLFGFAMIFFITQIYGLKLPKKVIVGSQIIFLLIMLSVYSGLFNDNTIVDINEVIRIPFIEYGLVFLIVFVIYLPIYLNNKFGFNKTVKKVFFISLYVLLTVFGVSVIYINSPYTADPLMYDRLSINHGINQGETSKYFVLTPQSYDYNIIIIPGGKVQPDAYLYLAAGLANEGHKVTIVKPLLNLAILSPNQAEDYLEDDKINVVIGHSLGGVVASMVVANNPDIDYMILLGSYNIKEIETTKTLIISAEFDIQMDLVVYEESVQDITNLTEINIEGGNHAFFGFYGDQRGDGDAEFPNVVQQDIVISLIIQYLENY